MSRGKHLRELVFRYDNEAYETNKRDMAVAINLESLDGSGEKLVLRRELDVDGVSYYKVNN
jgi:hypothetical protein